MVLLWLPWFFFSTKTFQSVKVSLFLNNSLQSNDFIKGNYFACIHFFLAAQLTWVQTSLSEMFHHKCFHLRVKIDYAVWSVERGEVLIGTVIGDCDSRFDNLSETWQQSTVAFKLLSPEWQGVCLFRSPGQFFSHRGEGVEEFWM